MSRVLKVPHEAKFTSPMCLQPVCERTRVITPIKVHILIKTILRISSGGNILTYTLITVFGISRRCTQLAVAASRCRSPGTLPRRFVRAETPIRGNELSLFCCLAYITISSLFYIRIQRQHDDNTGEVAKERQETRRAR